MRKLSNALRLASDQDNPRRSQLHPLSFLLRLRHSRRNREESVVLPFSPCFGESRGMVLRPGYDSSSLTLSIVPALRPRTTVTIPDLEA